MIDAPTLIASHLATINHPSYVDGFETGKYWDHSYRPGGPWIHARARKGGGYDYDPESLAAHHLWHAGWLAGMKVNPKRQLLKIKL